MTKPMVCSWALWGGAQLQFFCIRATRQVQTDSLSFGSPSSLGRQILNWGLVQNVSVEEAGQDGCALLRWMGFPAACLPPKHGPLGSDGPLTLSRTLTPVTWAPSDPFLAPFP